MLIVISPAKRLDTAPARATGPLSAPCFAAQAAELARRADALGASGLSRLMGISDALGRLNAERFAQMVAEEGAEHAGLPAVLTFAGDTYAGLEAASLDDEELDWAQHHLRILSGLYGVLRPLDAIRPYRLEMGTRLAVGEARDLYQYWGTRPAEALRSDAAALGTDVLINCASVEYFGAVDTKALGLRVITPRFEEERPEGAKIISFFAKKARGAMARFIIQRRLTSPEGLADFDIGGYRFQPDLSTPEQPVFRRPAEAVAA